WARPRPYRVLERAGSGPEGTNRRNDDHRDPPHPVGATDRRLHRPSVPPATGFLWAQREHVHLERSGREAVPRRRDRRAHRDERREGSSERRGRERFLMAVKQETAGRSAARKLGLPSGLLDQTGRMFSLTLDAFHTMLKRPLPIEEFVRVSWFIASVSIVPVILVSLAFGMVIALQVGNIARQL